jgi:RNA polymerase sigma-70 factor (ECF subfamily)
MTVNTTHANPGDLVRRCVDGDDAARAEFISTYDGLIRSAVARRIQRTAAARANAAHIDDITHDVYVRLFADGCRALNSVRHAQRLSAWLVTVSQNQTIAYLRKIGVTGLRQDDVANETPAPYEQSPDRRAIRNELTERLATCLAKLDDKDRLVLQLFYVYNLRYVDIASSLNMNINTVASRMLRAKQRLRGMLQEYAE